MSHRAEWVLASGNRGKLEEFQALLADAGIVLRSQSSFGIAPVAETASTFVENALAKARHASAAAGLPALADDSGLCVDALGGAPGLRSARYAGTGASDAANIAKLLGALSQIPDVSRSAHFVCVIVALEHPLDPAPTIAMGRWDGRIARTPRGQHGFGYDPVFVPGDGSTTVAEMAPAEKNRSSHRAQALARLRAALVI
jgi:XTP/dITP diphosphohydrolase